MPKTIEGAGDAAGMRVCIVASRFNDFIVGRLIEGACRALTERGAKDGDITIVRVPGSFEIPAVARMMSASKDFDAVVCLGCVIKGETDHYDLVIAEMTRGIGEVALLSAIPVIFGVLATHDVKQAVERAGPADGNRGIEAAVAAIEMVNLKKALG